MWMFTQWTPTTTTTHTITTSNSKLLLLTHPLFPLPLPTFKPPFPYPTITIQTPHQPSPAIYTTKTHPTTTHKNRKLLLITHRALPCFDFLKQLKGVPVEQLHQQGKISLDEYECFLGCVSVSFFICLFICLFV
jgi:hypothetical protein